jgi:hypothetical protein
MSRNCQNNTTAEILISASAEKLISMIDVVEILREVGRRVYLTQHRTHD